MSAVRERVMRDVVTELEAVDDRGAVSLMDTFEATSALNDGPEKERLLVRLAAEAIFFATDLREERETEAVRTVTFTPETHGEHVARFEPGVRSVEPNDAPSATITVTRVDKVGAWTCRCGATNRYTDDHCYQCPGLREDHR